MEGDEPSSPCEPMEIEHRPSRRSCNLRACQLLLGDRKLESTVRYLGLEFDDALEISEQIDL